MFHYTNYMGDSCVVDPMYCVDVGSCQYYGQADTNAMLLPFAHQTELVFPCQPEFVGHIVGRHWSFIQHLTIQYKQVSGHDNISITYDGEAFRARFDPHPYFAQLIMHELGQRVYVANQGIHADPIGSIIGKKGWWLRKTEQEQSVPCTIYNFKGKFHIKFPTHICASDRMNVLDNITRKIQGRCMYFKNHASDCESNSTNESTETVTYMPLD